MLNLILDLSQGGGPGRRKYNNIIMWGGTLRHVTFYGLFSWAQVIDIQRFKRSSMFLHNLSMHCSFSSVYDQRAAP